MSTYIGGPCCGDLITKHQALPLTTGDYAVANPLVDAVRIRATFVYRPVLGGLQFVERIASTEWKADGP